MKKEIIMALSISTTNLVKNFDGKNAVNGISLDVHQGEIFGILGPNGAGKTTFLRMLATLTKVTSGSASIFGNDLTKDGAKVRNFIGLTGQYASVDEELTGMENMIIFGQLNGLSKKEAKKTRPRIAQTIFTDRSQRQIHQCFFRWNEKKIRFGC